MPSQVISTSAPGMLGISQETSSNFNLSDQLGQQGPQQPQLPQLHPQADSMVGRGQQPREHGNSGLGFSRNFVIPNDKSLFKSVHD